MKRRSVLGMLGAVPLAASVMGRKTRLGRRDM